MLEFYFQMLYCGERDLTVTRYSWYQFELATCHLELVMMANNYVRMSDRIKRFLLGLGS